MRIKRLSSTQIRAFDREHVSSRRWETVKKCIDDDFADREFSFLDLGGGNGLYADKILHSYPNATGTVLDNSEVLLSKNKNHKRKRIILESVANMERGLNGSTFDIIFINWLLHHLVSNSYRETTKNLEEILTMSRRFLCANGRISVLEIMYNGTVVDNLPGQIIFHLTSSKKLANAMKKFGANTAGVGVCLRSKRDWLNIMSKSGLRLLSCFDDKEWKLSLSRRLFLHLRNVRVGHLWLEEA